MRAGIPTREITLPKARKPLLKPPNPLSFIEGWARRPKASITRFTAEQIAFLQWAFDGGDTVNRRKIKHSEARRLMESKFCDTSPESAFSTRLRLTEQQIQSWFSSRRAKINKEQAREQERAARAVIDRAISEVSVTCELGEGLEGANGEGGGGLGLGEQASGGDECESMSDGEAGAAGSSGGVGASGIDEGAVSAPLLRGGGGAPVVDEDVSDLTRGACGDESVNPQGTVWFVVREEWEEDGGFEVWELQGSVAGERSFSKVLQPEQLVSVFHGRKWVHEVALLDVGQGCRHTNALKDRGTVSVRLGVSGSRRFAPRLGRPGETREIEQATYGHVWVQIQGMSYWNFTDSSGKLRSPSFVFTSEQALIKEAYGILRSSEED